MEKTNLGMLSEAEFRRLTGVKKQTHVKMLELLGRAQSDKKARGGRENKLSLEDMLLMSLEYLREYRTYFHIGQNYGVSESYAYKIIRWVEDTIKAIPAASCGVFKKEG